MAHGRLKLTSSTNNFIIPEVILPIFFPHQITVSFANRVPHIMSLLSPLEKEIDEVFNSPALKKYVTNKLDDDEDEPDLPEREKDQSPDEWRLAAIKAMGGQGLNDPIFSIKTKAKQEMALSLQGLVLVEGATYYVFPGEMSAETATEFTKDFSRPVSPRSVNNSIRFLIKKKHDQAEKRLADRVAAQVSQSNRGSGNQRGNWNKARGGRRGGFGGPSNRNGFAGWNRGFNPTGSWRPGF